MVTTNLSSITSPVKLKNIMDLDLDANLRGASFELKSPRTLEALKRLGLNLEELEPVSKDDCKNFYVVRDKVSNPPSEFVELRYNMLN